MKRVRRVSAPTRSSDFPMIGSSRAMVVAGVREWRWKGAPYAGRALPVAAVAYGLSVLLLSAIALSAGADAVYRRLPGDAPSSARNWAALEGSPAVLASRIDGRDALVMACPFGRSGMSRAGWDCDVPLDLRTANGIRFLMRCADGAAISHWTVYLRSGGGWYAHSVTIAADGAWHEVRLLKRGFTIEESPSGWGRVDRIRVAAWRGGASDTRFELSEFGVLPSRARIAVIWNHDKDSLARREGEPQAREMGEHLDALGIESSAVDCTELDAALLARYRLVVLPNNPALPSSAVAALAAFVRSGGKVLAFYCIPPELLPLVGMRAGVYASRKYPDQFATMRAVPPLPAGMPSSVAQASWNVQTVLPAGASARVAAWWYDGKGVRQEFPAVVISDRGAFVSHILLKDDLAGKRQLLMALVGALVPGEWRSAAERRLAETGRFGPYADFAAARKGVVKLGARDATVRRDVVRADADRAAARAAFEKEDYPGSIAASNGAHEALRRAYCAAQSPRKGEFRAFWCHSAFGLDNGITWDEAVKRLAANGFTAVFANMCWGGVAFYPSRVLPVHPTVKERGDQVAACLAACRKYGVECHVWKVNFNMGWPTSADTVRQMTEAGRLAVGDDGKALPRWLSPSDPANQDLEIRSMVELAQRYELDGLHFDYIRYPSETACFSENSRKRFEAALGRPVATWPKDVGAGGAWRAEWNEFRRQQITRVVREVSRAAREARPGIKISAAVFPDWSVHRDSIGQDWKRWCDKGYVDFVCPMNYTVSNDEFGNRVGRQVKWVGGRHCVPGIGLSTWPDNDAVQAIQQILLTREQGAKGFILFNYGLPQANDVLPLLGAGITRR